MSSADPPRSRRTRGIIRLYREFWRYAEGSRRLAVLFLALLISAQMIRLLIPFFFGGAVNALQDNAAQDVAGAARNIALMFAAVVVAWLLHAPGRIVERFVAANIRERFADHLYDKVINLPLRWHRDRHSGETLHRMGKATGALSNFSQNQFVYLQNIVNFIGPIVALTLISPVIPTAVKRF